MKNRGIVMLPVYLEVPREAKKIINKNVGYMFELLKCTCEGLSYAEVLDSIYPSYILDIKLEKCVQTIKELYNMTQDNYEREALAPFYEWTLFHTISWWLDVTDENDLDEIPRKYCTDRSGEDRYDYINNIKNYIEFLFRDWDFLDLEIIYSIYKNNPELLESFLYIDVENYLELMPNDIVKEYQAMKERRKSSMDGRSNMTFNITGGQINIAKDNGNVNAIQNNGIGNNELDAIIGEIKNDLSELKKEDAEEIMDIVDMAREELAKTQPKVSRLRNCITLIAPMMTIANGIPTLSSNLQKFQEFIMNCKVNPEKLREILSPQNRQYGDLYDDYCGMQENLIKEAADASAEKIMLIAMSYKPETKADDVNVLFKYYRELQVFFDLLKINTRQLMPEEVLSVLYQYYHPFDTTEFRLPQNIFKSGGKIKDYIAPSMFAFKAKEVEVGTADCQGICQ